MERPLLSDHSDNLEENDFNLVLEQLQEKGFSSFFDHPECPFSSLQEVDQALKELEKEFLKICEDNEAKPPKCDKYRSGTSVGPSSSTINQGQIKNNNKLQKFQSEHKHKFESIEQHAERKDDVKKLDKRSKFGSKAPEGDEMKNIDHDKDKNTGLASGDTTEVCAIDSSGNKYSLKIEVFATVKLEDCENNENALKMLPSQSTQKVKPKKSVVTFQQVKKNPGTDKQLQSTVSRDECEACPPLLLSYRSSMSKPCPSYMNHTALDLRKNAATLRAKPEPFPNKPDTDHLKFVKNNLTNKMLYEVNQIIDESKTLDTEMVTPCNSPEPAFDHDALVNYSLLDKEMKFSLEEAEANFIKHTQVESRSIQTIDRNFEPNNRNVSDTYIVRDLIYRENNCHPYQQKTMITQQHQTSFEIIGAEAFNHNKEDVSTGIPSEIYLRTDTTDESINTSLLSMFNVSKITGSCSRTESCTSGNLEHEIVPVDSESSCQLEKNINLKYVEIGCIEPESQSDLPCSDNSKRSMSREIQSPDLTHIGVEVGGDSAPMPISVNSEEIVDNIDNESANVEQSEMPGSCTRLLENEVDNKSEDRVTLESSSKETVIMKSDGSLIAEKDRLTTIKEECSDSSELKVSSDSSSAVISDKIDKKVGLSEEIIIHVDKTPVLLDREVDCMSMPSKINLESDTSTSIENEKEISPKVCQVNTTEKHFVDREVWMSKEDIDKVSAQSMVDKEVYMSAMLIKNKSTMMDKNTDEGMVDKDIETMVESKSMCTFMDGSLKTCSDKGITAGSSEQSVSLTANTPSTDLSWIRESSSEQETLKQYQRKSDPKMNRLSGSKTFVSKFKRLDPKAAYTEKLKMIRDNNKKEKRKSDEGSTKKESFTKKIKQKQDPTDRDSNLSTVSSSEQPPRNLSGYHKSNELSEYETKFVKGVFARSGSAGKNKLAMKRRAFSNLDHKLVASRLAKSKKSMGSIKTSKKSITGQLKTQSSGRPSSRNRNITGTTSTGEYKLPDNTVINVEE